MDFADIDNVKEQVPVLVGNLNNRGNLSNYDVIQQLKLTFPAVIKYNLKPELSQIKGALKTYLSNELESEGYNPFISVCALLKKYKRHFTKAEYSALFELVQERFDKEVKLVRDGKEASLYSVMGMGKELSWYYSKQQKFDSTDNVLNDIIDSIQASDPNMPALRKVSLYRDMVTDVRNMGRQDVLDRINIVLQENAPHIKEEMGVISIPLSIPVEMIEDGYNTLMDGLSTEECLMKFALHYAPRDSQYDSYAKQYLEGAGSLSMFSHLIFKEDGNLSHKVGTGEENKDEQYQHACSVSLQYMGVALHVIIMKGIEKGLFSVDNVMNFIAQIPSLSEKRVRIIEKGIGAYLDNDYVSSISILIPQIEYMVRLFFQLHGYTVTNNDQTGTTSDALGTLLDNDDIKLDDINFSRYLRLMLSQKTGWNMRNLSCHGISESFGMPHADRVFHIVLLMATLLRP